MVKTVAAGGQSNCRWWSAGIAAYGHFRTSADTAALAAQTVVVSGTEAAGIVLPELARNGNITGPQRQ
ncbi:hypothetical protein ACX80R_06460 [Paeniglutamicibacter antarcticus]